MSWTTTTGRTDGQRTTTATTGRPDRGRTTTTGRTTGRTDGQTTTGRSIFIYSSNISNTTLGQIF